MLICCTQLNGFKYYYQTLIVLFTVEWLQALPSNTRFICSQLNSFTYCYLTLIILSTLFIHLYTVKCFQVLLRNHHHHHHHVVPQARISLTLSHHFSLSFIASGWSSGSHPVSSHSCWMYVRAGRPFARSYVELYRSTSLMTSSLFLQQWPACLIRLTCIVFVMGSRWPYNWCLVGCCRLLSRLRT